MLSAKSVRRSAACFAAMAMALLAFDAIAQPKPALIQNRDDPGRNHYQQHVHIVQDSTNCDDLYCGLSFNPVPAGKRLVITYASVAFSLNTPGTASRVYLGASSMNPIILPAAQSTGGSLYISASLVQYYVEAGQSPTIVVGFGLADGANMNAAIVGYYIDLP